MWVLVNYYIIDSWLLLNNQAEASLAIFDIALNATLNAVQGRLIKILNLVNVFRQIVNRSSMISTVSPIVFLLSLPLWLPCFDLVHPLLPLLVLGI